MKISAWGKYPCIDAEMSYASDLDSIKKAVMSSPTLIPMGMARSYGDSALQERILNMKKYNFITGFNEKTGVVTCQAGVTLEDLLKVFTPRGWFLPVTPGTKYVTVGGAIASDVHGKNHHKEGTFCDHVLSFELMTATGTIITCSPKKNSKVFQATCGGNGLTGVILEAAIQLKPVETAYIKERIIRVNNLNELISALSENEHFTYSVAWIDCLTKGKKMGRGVLMLGEHAAIADLKDKKQQQAPLQLTEKKKLNVPINFPGFVLNKLSVNLFNNLIYHKEKKGSHDRIIDYDTFFYPLDAIDNWNRIYGKAGFTQYQFVIPKEAGLKGLTKILQKITASGMGSFLAVLKIFGDKNKNMLSFPKEGYTLALDFPIRKKLFPFFTELDKLVLHYNGRLYPTKDARMSESLFTSGYPEVKEFMKIRKQLAADKKFHSLQSRRIGIK